MNKMRKPICLMLVLCLLCTLVLSGCGRGKLPEELKERSIIHEPEFGGVYITATIEEFNSLGYKYGDSVDILFSNGFKLEDQPYYNGYYTENGVSLLIAYPGYDYIKACINNGEDLWEVAGLSEEDTATIVLHERGRYLSIQEARDIHYTDKRSDYESDEAFANFRSVSVTGIAPDRLYRSASPCDNQHQRAPYVNALCEAAGINCILDLADTQEKIEGYIARDDFDSPYFLTLYENGGVLPLALNTNFTSEAFMQKLTAGLIAMTEQEGPYLVHCTEGKDRTGFVCILFEALCGADYEEIKQDYMITYDNYYRITEKSKAEQYSVIVEHVMDPMVRIFAGDDAGSLEDADLAAGARSYLLSAGMTESQIDRLIECLTDD